jgi:hypothetical protein
MLRSALLTPGAMHVMRASGAFYVLRGDVRAQDAAPAACVTRVGCALLTRLSRVCRCRARLARSKCAGPLATFGPYTVSHILSYTVCSGVSRMRRYVSLHI